MSESSSCAVVVTHNRKELLHVCLQALLQQTHAVGAIIVIDNASNDGTPKMLETHGYLADPKVRYVRMDRNAGGAGGFQTGIERAHAAGHDWIWVLDDDTILEPDALARLFSARAAFSLQDRPDLLASRVLWTDGTPHPMNAAIPKQANDPTTLLARRHGMTSIRASTFVSLLFHRRFVDLFGLPVADYFIWSDDIEYTARILRRNFGVLVRDSVAVHKTPAKHGPLTAPPDRFYYHVRNTCWMLLRSEAWSLREALPQYLGLALTIQATLRKSKAKAAALRAILRGLRDGLFARPGWSQTR